MTDVTKMSDEDLIALAGQEGMNTAQELASRFEAAVERELELRQELFSLKMAEMTEQFWDEKGIEPEERERRIEEMEKRLVARETKG